MRLKREKEGRKLNGQYQLSIRHRLNDLLYHGDRQIVPGSICNKYHFRWNMLLEYVMNIEKATKKTSYSLYEEPKQPNYFRP